MSFNLKGNLNGHSYFAFGEYYPKNKYLDSELNEDEVRLRQAIWGFKDGKNIEWNSKVIAEYMLQVLHRKQLEESILCVIPASTIAKTQIRYEKFCAIVSEKTGMLNGYNIITNKVDHDAGHLFGKSKDVLGFLSFNEKLIAGKEIVLFDDVTTRGDTFSSIAEHLKKLSAKNITGIFLGKTTYKGMTVDELLKKFPFDK